MIASCSLKCLRSLETLVLPDKTRLRKIEYNKRGNVKRGLYKDGNIINRTNKRLNLKPSDNCWLSLNPHNCEVTEEVDVALAA